jgi:hypothetical protein
MKMRALTVSHKKKLKEIAAYLAKNGNYAADVIPPAYPCDRERLVVICVSVAKAMPDSFRRFCMELSKDKAQNVALIACGAPENANMVADWIRGAGTNFVDDILYVKCGLFGGMKADDQKTVEEWYQNVLKKLS